MGLKKDLRSKRALAQIKLAQGALDKILKVFKMINSMTGFGSYEAEIDTIGRITVELRCTNHKFLESVFHLPDGLLSLEEKLKKILS